MDYRIFNVHEWSFCICILRSDHSPVSSQNVSQICAVNSCRHQHAYSLKILPLTTATRCQRFLTYLHLSCRRWGRRWQERQTPCCPGSCRQNQQLMDHPCWANTFDWLMIAYIVLFSALLSRLTMLARGSTWVTSFLIAHFFNIRWGGVLTALAWLVPHETAAVLVQVLCTPYNHAILLI